MVYRSPFSKHMRIMNAVRNSAAPEQPMRHCAFYWSETKGGEPVDRAAFQTNMLTANTPIKTYRTFDTEFEARGFAGAHGGEYKLLPMPEQAKDVYAVRPKALPDQKVGNLAVAFRTQVLPDHDDDVGDYKLTHFKDDDPFKGWG